MKPIDQKSKKVICFVDDDPSELRRFESAMSTDFQCVLGQGYEECMEKLRTMGTKPELWVLDLYFPTGGVANTGEELAEMNTRYADLDQQVRNFQVYLKTIGQGREGGIELIQKCLKDHRVPVIMLTRKGTQEDAIFCLKEGAKAMLKKPMPPEGTIGTQNELDVAMATQAYALKEQFHTLIKANTFWNKNRARVTFVLGAVLGAIISNSITVLITAIR